MDTNTVKFHTVAAKDIETQAILDAIDAVKAERGIWASRWDIAAKLPPYPPKVILAKLARLIRQGVITGCACGCRGDFERKS